MDLKSLPFSDLPFTSLFRDYINQDKKITNFFESSPFDPDQIKELAKQIRFSGNREQLVDELKEFNSNFTVSPETLKNIEQLRDETALTVVTGQQMVLYGGPLYTIYKTLTAIILAKQYENILNRPVVPVFWLADEDHDAEEISEIGLFDRDILKKCAVEFSDTGRRVGEYSLEEVVEDLKSCLSETLFDTDFSEDLWNLLNSSYKKENTVLESFGILLSKLFGKYGLVLAGSNSDSVKELTKSSMIRSIEKADDIYDRLTVTTNKLSKAGYHNQVHLNKSNLFFIDENNQRLKIQFDDEIWFTEEGDHRWSSKELMNQINEEPNKFSPNVFLRPILQDHFLPVLCYVGGPGEIAYYAQMKSIYPIFDQKMPVIAPRFSGTVIESGVDRVLDKLPFSVSDYNARIEDLESDFINQTDQPDLEALFGDWKDRIDTITDEKKEIIGDIDPTLKNTAGKASATYFTELDKLKGKLYKSLKQQEKTQLDRIAKIQSNLYPDGNLQEREIAFIYYLNKYGLGLIDDLFDSLQNEKPDTHKLIHL
ncbi:bacillithiol biosynthesis cysteine-adding enzyme BshC [Rhodohalobacter barkolensis]|uniref:Putative cysteine ligase BshC n=1 Tax=Rhodohalobacter barkolensis TaxID=2053187 RepID=A0A2N0VK15_9BACT|nr:bacillithiol biosynthesis cysteine-adding enzyme BshC [Rhodohalobacter barkolensis]PKD44521.1 bacillithiol biosynthesis cysteine-adding enzyme BshC [Rhodohalobacter barkolensis]